MEIQTSQQLASKKCEPCKGGIAACSVEIAQQQLKNLDGWQLNEDNQSIRKNWTMKNFVQALSFLNAVGEIAESEGHHPDLHLEGYKNVWIEISTHDIGGLSQNDFILAAKINQLENQPT